jgi:hypothetical protein
MRSVVVSLLLTLRVALRDRAALQLEILALRHQLHVLNRSRPQRLRLTQTDRMLWVWLLRRWDEWRAAVVIVKPETLLAWHRRGFRLFWTWKSQCRVGRPSLPRDVRQLIRTMAEANPLWGTPRIHGELLKLGLDSYCSNSGMSGGCSMKPFTMPNREMATLAQENDACRRLTQVPGIGPVPTKNLLPVGIVAVAADDE